MQADLVIIGAGPAGLAAARTAAKAGLSVTLLDEQPRPGGQIYRDVDRVAPLRGDLLGTDYTHGRTLTSALTDPNIRYISGATVWAVEGTTTVQFTKNGHTDQITAKRLLLATGALERPMPLPGWTLPGVMTAGAGQILLKQSGVLASKAVLVGSGPLLYLIAVQMLRAGTPPRAMIETQTKSDFRAALPHLGGALRGWRYLLKGAGVLRDLRRARVPRFTAARDIVIEGDTTATGVRFTCNNTSHHIACDTVYLHHGVVPNTQIARSIDLDHHWDCAQSAFVPSLDDWGQTTQDHVFIAGDSAGIGGAKLAALAGNLAALRIAETLGKLSTNARDRAVRPLWRARQREAALRPFLDHAYPPASQAQLPQDTTIICRCEDVTAGDIRRFADLGCLGPNQAKAFGRAGMGPCQGRYCGLTVSMLLADANRASLDATGYYRIRPPIKPVTLAELAARAVPTKPANPDHG